MIFGSIRHVSEYSMDVWMDGWMRNPARTSSPEGSLSSHLNRAALLALLVPGGQNVMLCLFVQLIGLKEELQSTVLPSQPWFPVDFPLRNLYFNDMYIYIYTQ